MASPTEQIAVERRQKVDLARQSWIRRLVDMSRRNNLLYFRDLKVGTLDLTDAPAASMRMLLQSGRVDGDGVELQDLVTPERKSQATAALAEIAKRALANYEERGLDTLFMAMGLATWTAQDGGRDTSAPVLLVPVEARQQGGRNGPWLLRRKGEVKLNDVLVHALKEEHGITLSADDVLSEVLGDDHGEDFDLEPVFASIAERARPAPGFGIARRWVLGNFAFQKMAIVKDLAELGDSLAGHDIVAGIAGDAGAAQTARGGRDSMDPRQLDQQLPDHEFLIRDADSSQQQAIALTLRGQNGVISGPPGTGKSQTISNLIAELVAHGKTVLFVAEKRAALDVVLNRLDDADLGHLCLDCHGAELSRREIAQQFQESLTRVREAPAADATALHTKFVDRRARLNAHDNALHAPRLPWGIGLYELYGRLMALPQESKLRCRLPQKVVAAIDQKALDAACDQMRELASLAGLFTGESSSPWTGATLTTKEEVRGALERARRLAHERWPQWEAAAHALAAEGPMQPPDTIGKVSRMVEVLQSIDGTLDACDASIFRDDLPQLVLALAPARSSLSTMVAWLTNGPFRAAVRAVRAHATAGKLSADGALATVERAAAQLGAWREVALDPSSFPSRLSRLSDATTAWSRVLEDLAPLVGQFPGRRLNDLAVATLGGWFEQLASDATTALQLLKVYELVTSLKAQGFEPVLLELAASKPLPALWADALRRTWLQSCLDEMQLQAPEIAGFDGRRHDGIAEEFRQLDKERLVVAVRRVQRAHAVKALDVRNRYPDQDTLVRREASKKSRHLPLRKMFDQAGDVLVALRPCWMASPLSVSQLIPGDRQRFDVVIFDEASQVLPEDAVTSLLRGRQAVIAGDQRQLPPTTFFAAGEPGESEEDESATAGFQSILDTMTAFLEPSWSLDWHYRSQDEALIAYSNHRIYNRRLVTFPGTGGVGAVRHDLVPHVAAAGAQEASVSAEVRRVVELVRRHAAEQPDDSLGVITMGIEHARRIEMALDRARQDDPALDRLYAEGQPERFFVKNLERVQGDERDAIILSIGYGKNDAGQLVYRFGPLLQDGGERRLNVAITRARRQMTVVSSFSHHDMDANYHKEGVRMLRGFLEYAASGGQHFERGVVTAEPLNDFEQSVFDELTRRGLKLQGQVGSSRYRIDMVAMHPEQKGRFVLAIECDGASYHSAPTARDRDRLRQQQLEALGWRFHRIWSTDWFLRREEEVQRTLRAFEEAVRVMEARSSEEPERRAPVSLSAIESPGGQAPAVRARSARPDVPPGRGSIADYRSTELVALIRWIRSDGVMHTNEEIVAEVTRELGFRRRGAKIIAAVEAAVRSERS